IYTLDLVESGVEKNPFYDPSVSTLPSIAEGLATSLPDFPEVQEKLAHKISEIYNYSPLVALSIAESFRLFDFRVVDESLIDIHDVDQSIIVYDPKALVPLALRHGITIYLNGSYWPMLGV